MATKLTEHARALRFDGTPEEFRLCSRLKDRRLHGLKGRRQSPVEPFIADFLCKQAMLIVELDGSQHSEHVAYDERRTRFLENAGYKVIRFWNGAVRSDLDGVLDVIWWEAAPRLGPHSPIGFADGSPSLPQAGET